METFTATIPAESLAEVKAKVVKFNARAAKKGLPVVALQVGPAVERSYRNPVTEVTEVWTEHECSLTAPALTIGRYVLTARVESLTRDGEVEAFVVTAPGQTVPSDLTIADPWACQHCGTARRRSETFLVTEVETGKVLQVGRNCLRDFLGHDPAALLTYWRALDEFTSEEEESGWGSAPRAPRQFKADDVLRLTARVVAAEGWLSRSKAVEGEVPTATHVEYLLNGPHGNAKAVAAWDAFNARCAWNEKAEAIYNLTRTAVDELAAKERRVGFLGDWEENIVRLATADYVPARRVGYLASAVVLGWKRVNAPRKPEVEALAKHEVAEGDKVTITGTVVYQNVMDGNWGATTLVKVETTGPRRLFVWWASGAWAFEKGETITLKGTVKRVGWDDYAKAEAATLTRCKVSK